MRKDLILVTLLISILALMVIPLPAVLVDALLGINISLAVLLLMVAVYLRNPSDFSTFPTVILIATAFRLSLSIATTRLILSEADAGQIIATFGDFVVRGSVVIGLVIFLIITVVQFVVVTKGAERVAEVAARFTLDAMPGKQMSIEADIRAGTLEQADGAAKRAALDKNSQFFGAMDGAMKFVKGDAIAGLIIIFINLLGGIAVGTSVHGMSLAEATSVYSLLTIGDGLVAQIPALLMSLCAGTIVTRVSKEESQDLGSDIAKELASDPRVPAVAALTIFAFGFVPGFPFFVFAAVSGVLFASSIFIKRTILRDAVDAEEETSIGEEADEIQVTNDRIGIRISREAARNIEIEKIQQQLGQRMAILRSRYGVEFKEPFIQIFDPEDESLTFQIEMDEVPIEGGIISSGRILTTASNDELRAAGIDDEAELVEWIPSSAPWRTISASQEHRLSQAGLTVSQYEVALAESLFRHLERNIRTLFSTDEYAAIIESAKQSDEVLANSVTELLSQHELMRMFRYLLEDGIPLRPIHLLFEGLAHWKNLHEDADPIFLAECLRHSMRRQMCKNLANSSGELGVVPIAPSLQDLLVKNLQSSNASDECAEIDALPIEPAVTDFILAETKEILDSEMAGDHRVALIVEPRLRRRLRNFLAAAQLTVPVISPHEISTEITTIPLKLLGQDFPEMG